MHPTRRSLALGLALPATLAALVGAAPAAPASRPAAADTGTDRHDPKPTLVLVHIAAFTPDKGESAAGLAAKFPGSTLGDTVNPRSYPLPGGGTGTELVIERSKPHQQFAADVPTADAAVMAVTQRPVATAALEERAGEAAWRTIPSRALIATADKNIPPAAERWMARRAGSQITEVDASHAIAVSRPAVVTHVILAAARATR